LTRANADGRSPEGRCRDGNGLVLREVNARLTGHIDEDDTSFTPELTSAVRRVEAGKGP